MLSSEVSGGSIAQLTPLKSAQECIYRSMFACRSRDAYWQLSNGSYNLSESTVRITAFADMLKAARRLVTSTILPVTVKLDELLCTLVLENAITNAFRHGHPRDPDVRFHIVEDVGHTSQVASPLSRQVSTAVLLDSPPDPECQHIALLFHVSNRVDPQRLRVTTAEFAAALAGEDSTISYGTGLRYIRLGAQAHGMECSIEARGDRVVFQARVLLEKVTADDASAALHNTRDVRLCCIDDSSSQRLLLRHALRSHFEGSSVQIFGEVAEETTQFVSAALSNADIAILDQNLEYEGHVSCLGTDLMKELLEKGFRGMLCIRSSNTAAADEVLYRNSGAHCIVGKDLRMSDMVMQIKAAYALHTRAAADTASPSRARRTGPTSESVRTWWAHMVRCRSSLFCLANRLAGRV